MANDVTSTLSQRGTTYGAFASHAQITQDIKSVMYKTAGWDRLSAAQKEALDMVVHKIGRILNGDPNYADSWHDIQGYAKLVEDILAGNDGSFRAPLTPPADAPVAPKAAPSKPVAEAPANPAPAPAKPAEATKPAAGGSALGSLING